MDFANTNQLVQALIVCACVFALIMGISAGRKI